MSGSMISRCAALTSEGGTLHSREFGLSFEGNSMIFGAVRLSTAIGVALAALCLAGSTLAQQTKDNTVAKLKDAEGNVLVTQGDAMVPGANDQRLAVGTRIVTTNKA